MAHTAIGVKVGAYVYRPFEITKPGKVIAIHRRKRNPLEGIKLGDWLPVPVGTPHTKVETFLEVKWLDGTVTEEWELHLNDFNYATDEHLKKYNKFDALRAKLKPL